MGYERAHLRGRVQGVGMRPTLYLLARARGLKGQIRNDGRGVEMTLDASTEQMDELLLALTRSLPPLARIDDIQRGSCQAAPDLGRTLRIVASAPGEGAALVLPDAASCAACVAECLSPADRRSGYPFGNCTHCGPRLSIQCRIPWDRDHTSMRAFALCADCAREYADPTDRRYHAEPIACPVCGPRCWLVDGQGEGQAQQLAAIEQTVDRLRAGQILAIKALGGFHLACDAQNAAAIARLRARKQRPAKPLALMARDPHIIRRHAECGAAEEAMLRSAAAPIVLLARRSDCGLPEGLAPGLRHLGWMLPATPLQHLLLRTVDFPLVMSSGNLAGEPPCTGNDQALAQLGPVAEAFLLNDREIANRLDDSVVQIGAAGPQVLRLGRGLAPAQAGHGWPQAPAVLALGAQLKAGFVLLRAQDWIGSQHIGDLQRASNLADYEQLLDRYLILFAFRPEHIAVDCHPDYLSHQFGRRLARKLGAKMHVVQHHHAHAVACLVEHGAAPQGGPWLAVCFDGLGLGERGELWGGEFLQVDYCESRRLGRWRPSALPGASAAVTQPWRNLYAVIEQCGGWTRFRVSYPRLAARLTWPSPPQLLTQLVRNLQLSPLCSSVGRSFDALAWLLGVAPDTLSYEGEAAMRLEACATPVDGGYPLTLAHRSGLLELDWRDLWSAVFADLEAGVDAGAVAQRFHRSLADAVVEAVTRLRQNHNLASQIVLCGGVFQNRTLFALCLHGLQDRGLGVWTAQQMPCNDGGIALGQAFVAAARSTCAEA